MRPNLLGFILFLLAASLMTGVSVDRYVREHAPLQRAAALAGGVDPGQAEQIYWDEILRRPQEATVPLVIAFLEARDGRELTLRRITRKETRERHRPAASESVHNVSEKELDAFLDDPIVPEDVRLLGQFWRATCDGSVSSDLRHAVEKAADAEQPTPWANSVLAWEAVRAVDDEAAAKRFLREALFFARPNDIESTVTLSLRRKELAPIAALLANPEVARHAPPWVPFIYAVETRDWKAAARWSWLAAFDLRASPGAVLLAVVAALTWFLILCSLGSVVERPLARISLYLASFVLGVVSIYFTVFALAVEDAFVPLEQAEEFSHNALFFLSVGTREECLKLLAFVPVAPLLARGLRRGTFARLDVLVAGAMVGLGFATFENLGYFQDSPVAVALLRFLTANFFHMAATALSATALVAVWLEPRTSFGNFLGTLALVILLHGAYDCFLLTSGWASYLSMVSFLVLARRFMREIRAVRGAAARRIQVLDVFLVGMTAVVGASFVYGSALLGPHGAALALVEGILSTFIVIFFFVQEFQRA